MGLFSRDTLQTSTSSPQVNLLGAQPNVICTGLSGNELYCVTMSGYTPGNILVGNSVYSLGALGGIAANLHTAFGGEVPQYTTIISEGRRLALQRLEQEIVQGSALGATGVTSEVIFHTGDIEFLSVGSSLYARDGSVANSYMTCSADGQELFCQIDAGFQPSHIAFGNVAYSIGLARNLMGSIRQLTHGEVPEYSNIFSVTRNQALQRISKDARTKTANSVIGIRTTILPVGSKGMQEMMMLGTAAYHPQLNDVAQQVGGVITSDLTAEEMWNVMRMGYVPMQLVLGTSVYSLGVLGGVKAALRGIAKGEVNALTEMVYGAREQSMKKVQDQAAAVGADMVIGIKTYIYQLGSELIEFLAIGTAVKRVDGVLPRSDQLPPQAIIHDKATFVDLSMQVVGADVSHSESGVQSDGSHQSAPSPTQK
jgi:uncharacterized protein YbjQ (UPF0145 family)